MPTDEVTRMRADAQAEDPITIGIVGELSVGKTTLLTVADGNVASLTRAALQEQVPGPVRLYGPEPRAGLPGHWTADCGGAGRVLAQFADPAARAGEQFAALLMHAYRLCRQQNEALQTCRSATTLLRSNEVTESKQEGSFG